MTAVPVIPAAPAVSSATIAQLFDQLGDHLEAELGLHRRLLALTRAKQRHIVAGDMPAFSSLLQQEQAPMAEMGKLRQRRELILKASVQVLTLRGERPLLAQVVEAAPEPQRSALRRREGELRSVLEELRDANECTMALIRQSLSFVRDLLGTLVGETAGRPANAYDRRGSRPGAHGEGRLINTRG